MLFIETNFLMSPLDLGGGDQVTWTLVELMTTTFGGFTDSGTPWILVANTGSDEPQPTLLHT